MVREQQEKEGRRGGERSTELSSAFDFQFHFVKGAWAGVGEEGEQERGMDGCRGQGMAPCIECACSPCEPGGECMRCTAQEARGASMVEHQL